MLLSTSRVLAVSRVYAWMIVCACVLGACSSTDTTPDTRSKRTAPEGPIVAIEERVDHVMGTTLVMPVSVSADLATPGPIKALLEDGRDVGAALVWFAVTPDPEEHARWLPPAGQWSVVETPDPAAGSGPGFWAVVARLPLDAAGQGLWIDRGLIEINWIAIPPRGDSDPALAAVHPDASRSPGYDLFIAPELSGPTRRWRGRLSTLGIGRSLPALSSDADQPAEQADALESLAIQHESRWAVALLRLYDDDPDLCASLRRVICAHASFENGIWTPAWPLDTVAIDRLLFELLKPGSSASTRLRAARYFMEDQSPAVAWVIDDAGLIDAASGRALASLGVVNLGDRSTLAWAAPTESSDTPTLRPVPPGSGTTLTSTSTPLADGAGAVGVHVGRWSATRTVLSEPLAVIPPGLRMGPLLPGWTLEAWHSGADPVARPEDAPWTTAALLERLPGAEGDWTIYVECMRPPDAGNDADAVRLWLGPRTRPDAVFRITRDGSATNELSVQSQIELAQPVRVTNDRWTFRVRVPRAAVGADGVLTLGMERLGSQGRRWSWPRAMTPWQVEPGRLRLWLNAWN